MDASPNSHAAELSDAPLKSTVRNGDTLKRIFDILVTASIIVFISPIYMLIALAIKLSDPGPVFYSHRRIGRNGKAFGCLKFRTMVSNGDKVLADYFLNNPEADVEWATMRKLRHDPRVTSIGRILRKFSLDEIPQLSTCCGEISLVGPRRVMAEELVHYGLNKHLYFRVRPGLTGLWQISGRSELSYDKRVELDCHYVENWRFGNDIVIMVRTIPVVCSAKGSC